MLKFYLSKLFNPTIKKSRNFFDLSWDAAGLYEENLNNFSAYHKNVIVYRCVNLIAQSASHVPWVVIDGQSNKTVKDHPIYKLLKNPNPEKAGADFFKEVIASLLLFGNSYMLAISGQSSPPRELYILDANKIQVVKNRARISGYKYSAENGESFHPIDSISRKSKILHLKNYNPNDNIYGLSPLKAARLPIELHTSASIWNNSLLKNGARPSGALVVKDNNGYLSEEQFDRLQSQLYEKYTGSGNSGKPLLLEGGLSWQEMSINPKDMDFIESKNSAAREIALAFGVPPQLLGIRGDNTYSNMQEARLALWEETLIPLLDKISDALSSWLSYWYKQELLIDFDRDSISALTEKRENLWAKISAASFMTINEKRAFVGLDPIKGGDEIR
jgi:HK97 family phage portal protein